MKRGKTFAEGHVQVGLPPSKSLTHRALVAAALARGTSRIRRPLLCEDTLYTVEGLRRLGVPVEIKEGEMAVHGTDGHFPEVSPPPTLFLGNSGTSFRFLLALAALGPGERLLTGSPRMGQRPIGDLCRALETLGTRVTFLKREGFPPVRIHGRGLSGGRIRLPGDKSSQFVSALLLAAPCALTNVEITVPDGLVSKPYVDLTTAVMARFGVEVNRHGYARFRVPAPQHFRAADFTVEGDVSSASYFWAAAAVTGNAVTTAPVDPRHTLQGDIRFLDTLEAMGCAVERGTERITVRGGPLRAVHVDMAAMPDLVPTLAAVALFARGRTRIRNVAHLRLKESDRLKAVAGEWRRLGAGVEEFPDGLAIDGNRPLRPALTLAHDDHRIAMSLAVIALRIPGLRIEGTGCVAKSFPGFWEAWTPVKAALTGGTD